MSTISTALPTPYNPTPAFTGAAAAASAFDAAAGERGPGAATLANAQLGGAWSGYKSASSYGQLFGDASYVKNGSDPQLLQMLQQAVERAPELAGSPLAQHVQAGRVSDQDVQTLQNFLQSKGYGVGSTGVDGKYGPHTHQALEGFLEGRPPDAAAGAGSRGASGSPAAIGAATTPPARGNTPAAPAQANGDETPAGDPAADNAPAAPAQGSAGAQGGPGQHGPIGPGTKVLMIGDSHTAGTFGKELDHTLRGTGAQVESYGSSGSSPSWWLNGTQTHSGYVARHLDGSTEAPDWKTPHATPKLADLIQKDHPDVVVVNLGANMRGASPDQIKKQVQDLAKVATANGTRLVWVGPPCMQKDGADHGSIDRFYANLQDAVGPYGTLVDSRQATSHYAGADGIHFSGAQGSQISRGWAQSAFQQIQAS